MCRTPSSPTESVLLGEEPPPPPRSGRSKEQLPRDAGTPPDVELESGSLDANTDVAATVEVAEEDVAAGGVQGHGGARADEEVAGGVAQKLGAGGGVVRADLLGAENQAD